MAQAPAGDGKNAPVGNRGAALAFPHSKGTRAAGAFSYEPPRHCQLRHCQLRRSMEPAHEAPFAHLSSQERAHVVHLMTGR